MRIVDAVRQIREMDPGIGYYKLWLMMKRMFLCDWVPLRHAGGGTHAGGPQNGCSTGYGR